MPDSNGQFTIHTSGTQQDLLGLLEEFRNEDLLRGRITRPESRIADGQMGDLYDVLIVAVGAGGMAPALVRSLNVFLTHRRSDLRVTVKRTSDGTTVTLDGRRIQSPEVVQELRRLLGEPEEPR